MLGLRLLFSRAEEEGEARHDEDAVGIAAERRSARPHVIAVILARLDRRRGAEDGFRRAGGEIPPVRRLARLDEHWPLLRRGRHVDHAIDVEPLILERWLLAFARRVPPEMLCRIDEGL